jgi:hypothetical protein
MIRDNARKSLKNLREKKWKQELESNVFEL